ncbi:centromere protein N isoform X1 [Podarcis raffonei]|uniref:centromere protein N isoform X1 n=2 Tax=Podarcis raffonei TaxID=65483 RepID=UPI00232949F6|nr:centromere protein N isoform X1 [Podarcis raffonei]
MAKRRRLNAGDGKDGAEVFIMDERVAEYIRRTVLRIPRSEMGKMLATWGFLSETQLQSLNIHQLKENVSQEVVRLCEENHATIQHAADLDIIYNYTYRDKKLWTVYQMTKEGGDEYDIFDLADFKKKFKRSLQSALKNVTISFKEFEDNAIWIRIAWGTQYTKPNQYKPSYVAYISQTPYVFISSSRNKNCKPLLLQALLIAASYNDIHEMDLRSRCLDSLKDILLKRCSQKFQTHHPQPLQERNCILQRVDPNIVKEDKLKKERIERVNEEAFGDGPQPKLEFAQYKLETTFRNEQENGILNNKDPFRCMVKFSSPHLLESLKSLAPAGLADVPPSPLLTCITQKARNYFRINERKSALSQTLAS